MKLPKILLGLGLCLSASSQAAVTATNLSVYYSFDADTVSGTSFVDQWTEDGSADNIGRAGISTTAGKFGEAASTATDASTPRGLTADATKINSTWLPGTDDYTLSFWYRQGPATSNRIFAAGARDNNGSNDDGLQIYYTASSGIEVDYHDPSLAGATRDNFVVSSPGTNFDGVNWNHFALVRDDTSLDLWINGTKFTGATLTPGYNIAVAAGTYFREPNFGPGDDVAGAAWDDAAIWHMALSDSEIAQIYNNGDGTTIGSLVPEPSALALLGVGVLGFFSRRR